MVRVWLLCRERAGGVRRGGAVTTSLWQRGRPEYASKINTRLWVCPGADVLWQAQLAMHFGSDLAVFHDHEDFYTLYGSKVFAIMLYPIGCLVLWC